MNDERPNYPKIEIRHWLRDEVLYSTHACPDLKSAVEEAVSSRASLVGANLAYANLAYANLDGANLDGARLAYANLDGARLDGARLDGANLDGANLAYANLVGANLDGANLDGARLVGANLDRARLVGANLDGARMDWSSHDLVAEILLRKADESDSRRLVVKRRKVAGLILVSRDWCWSDFLRLRRDPNFDWALDVLAAHVIEGDNVPDVLRERAAKLKAASADPVPLNATEERP